MLGYLVLAHWYPSGPTPCAYTTFRRADPSRPRSTVTPGAPFVTVHDGVVFFQRRWYDERVFGIFARVSCRPSSWNAVDRRFCVYPSGESDHEPRSVDRMFVVTFGSSG